ncbi:FAD-dependent oxidoreductase [Sphingobium aquiterrae]|uniref:FAD-dependent oxidoreductase n=1 Tax=Sphingobium aquiterrae TaxID=2038656 RepID=UPI003019103E
MRHIAIIGSGPAGYYTAEACGVMFGEDAHVDIIDRMPAPFGLIRSGVAPDHQSIKSVSRRYESVALSESVRFVGNVAVGRDVSVAELIDLYDAVVLATGAPLDRALDIPGADLPGVVGSAAFVGWYNGHPDHAALAPPLSGSHVAIIGNGNVALDVARLLAKSDAEFAGSDIVPHARAALSGSGVRHITIIGRRGPHQATMSASELGELARLERATPHVDAADLPAPATDERLEPAQRRAMEQLRAFAKAPAAKPVTIDFAFFSMPVAIEGDDRAERLIVERTVVDPAGHYVGTGERHVIDASLIVSCIGYRSPPIAGVPYDEALGRFANRDGRIAPGLYCVGWARRGPTGTIGTNRPDGYRMMELVAADIGAGAGKEGREGLDRLLAARNIAPVTFRDWQKIEQAEAARAHGNAPREKFTSIADMLAAVGR